MADCILKPPHKKSITTKISDICGNIIFIILLIVFALLTSISFLSTTHLSNIDLSKELVNYIQDNFFANIVITALFLCAVIALGRYTSILKKINIRIATAVLLIFTTVMSLWWIMSVTSVPSADSGIIIDAAKSIALGDYTPFKSSYAYYNNWSYFLYYPFQLGYVFLCEIIFNIFGTKNWFVLQLLNIVGLNVAFAGLVKLTHMMFKNKAITVMTIFALGGCFQAIFFTTFSYGNLLGLGAGIWSVVFVALYMEKDNKLFIIPSAIFLSLSIILKYNNMIFLLAIAFILILHTIKQRKTYSLIALLLVCVVGIGGSKAIIYSYEVRSGVDLSGGVSQLLYLSMGLNTSDRAPGWYNGEAMEMYRDSGLDITKAEDTAKKRITQRLDYFVKSPAFAGNFIYEKLVSQWNEPTFESVWISEVKTHYKPIGELGTFIYSDTGKNIYDNYFNCYQQIIFLGFTVCMFCLLKSKNKNLIIIILPLVILGGLMYHMLFEAKSQYILTYFIMMIPFASYGIYRLSKLKILNKFLPNKHIIKANNDTTID